MDNLNEKMRERLEKWRKNTLTTTTENKLRENPPTYIARRDFGDEYHEEVLLQKEKNKRSNNGQRSGGTPVKL